MRYYSFLAIRQGAEKLELCRRLLSTQQPEAESITEIPKDGPLIDSCGTTWIVALLLGLSFMNVAHESTWVRRIIIKRSIRGLSGIGRDCTGSFSLLIEASFEFE
jgi:hypothetical protein